MIPRLPFRPDGTLSAWRLDRARHAAAWDSGEGAFRVVGRWNGRGVRAVHRLHGQERFALDPRLDPVDG